MNERHSGRTAEGFTFEIYVNRIGLSLRVLQVPGSRVDQLQLRARWRRLADGLLKIGVGQLVGGRFRALAGQVKDPHFVLVLGGQPNLSNQSSISHAAF